MKVSGWNTELEIKGDQDARGSAAFRAERLCLSGANFEAMPQRLCQAI